MKLKRERSQEDEAPYPFPSKKRLRTSPLEGTTSENKLPDFGEEIEEFRWRKEYLRPRPNMSYLLTYWALLSTSFWVVG